MDMVKKYLRGIICAVILVCFFLPFVTAKVSMFGISASESANLFDLFEETFWAYMLLLCPILVAVVNFVSIPQIKDYKNYINIGLPVLAIVFMFLAASNATGGADLSGMGIKISYSIGFWLMLLLNLALAGITVVNMLNLKGNPVFDFVNENEDQQAETEATVVDAPAETPAEAPVEESVQ